LEGTTQLAVHHRPAKTVFNTCYWETEHAAELHSARRDPALSCLVVLLVCPFNCFPKNLDFSSHARCAFGKPFEVTGAQVVTLEFVQNSAQCGSTEADLSHDSRQI
jgi:hypothetical protein